MKLHFAMRGQPWPLWENNYTSIQERQTTSRLGLLKHATMGLFCLRRTMHLWHFSKVWLPQKRSELELFHKLCSFTMAGGVRRCGDEIHSCGDA